MIPVLLAGSSIFKEMNELLDFCAILPGYLIGGGLILNG